jgi:carbon monoxide dehydrogenase subunit G
MDLEHRFTVGTSVEETWAAFNNLERVAPCFPGATLTSVDGDEFRGSVKVKLGPIALQYNGTGQFVERDEASRRAVIEAKGRDKRGNGTAAATVTARFSPDVAGTLVEVTTDLAITGKPAQFGRGVIQDVSDKLLGQFVTCLQDKLGGGSTEGEAVTEGATEASEAAEADGIPASATAPPSPAAPSPVAPAPPRQARAPEPAPDVQLDLWSTIAPVLAKRYAPLVLTGLGGLVVGILLGRRRSGA